MRVLGSILKYTLIAFVVLAVLTVGLAFGVSTIRANQLDYVNEAVTLQNRLHIPPLLEPRPENGEKVFDLAAQQGTTEFFPGKQTETRGFNGDYLGPTLRARTGDKVRINVTNRLDETTTVHWHGMHLPAAMDGGPHQIIRPGDTWQPNWTVTNEAATLWYHPHQMGTTGEQIYRGMAGLFIIDDENADSVGLPREYGVNDIPLVVQDREFDTNGQFVYERHGNNDALPKPAGMIGDTILVNGTHAPYVEVPAKPVRLRVLNASNGRRYNVGFSDDRTFHQVASDGGLLEAPVERTRMLLSAGERAEIVVDLSGSTDPVTLMSYVVVDDTNAFLDVVQLLFGENDEGQQFKLVEIRPQPSGGGRSAGIPQSLNTIERPDEAEAVTTRRFVMDARTINDKLMDHERVDVVVKKGDVEIWEVSNQSPFYHPFHVHGVQFTLLDRAGSAPPAYEQGWKDTVVVSPGESVRLIMKFEGYSDPHLPYMFHCHILEHEDMGMMGQFVVVDSLSDDVRIRSPLVEDPEAHHSH